MKYEDFKPSIRGGAGCLIYAKNTNKLLLILRSDLVSAPLSWSFPGGKIDEGEKPGRAARREVLEEIGFDLSGAPMRLIHVNDTHAPRFRFYTFATVVDREFEPVLNWESAEHRWCSADELPSPLHWGVRQTLDNKSSGKIFKKFLAEIKGID